MKSKVHGKDILHVEIQDITLQGIWIYIDGTEYFLPYGQYPWFKNARVSEIYNLKLLHGVHLYWPDLDVDLELESLKNPKRYPLLFKEVSK